jgi:predicted metal-dependent hydrolase
MNKPDFLTYFLQGMRHFNAREFWEAHEAWETIWLAAESDVEQFLQGLIQVAAAYHHIQRGTYRGAARLITAGLARLAPFSPNYCGVDRAAVEKAARRHREWLEAASLAPKEPLPLEEYPKLVAADGVPIAPTSLQW